MDPWLIAVILVAALGVGYIIRNGSRNSDPLNRACSAELCHLALDYDRMGDQTYRDLALQIFEKHHRYQKQALHCATMVPVLLMKNGLSRDYSMRFLSILTEVAMERPR